MMFYEQMLHPTCSSNQRTNQQHATLSALNNTHTLIQAKETVNYTVIQQTQYVTRLNTHIYIHRQTPYRIDSLTRTLTHPFCIDNDTLTISTHPSNHHSSHHALDRVIHSIPYSIYACNCLCC